MKKMKKEFYLLDNKEDRTMVELLHDAYSVLDTVKRILKCANIEAVAQIGGSLSLKVQLQDVSAHFANRIVGDIDIVVLFRQCPVEMFVDNYNRARGIIESIESLVPIKDKMHSPSPAMKGANRRMRRSFHLGKTKHGYPINVLFNAVSDEEIDMAVGDFNDVKMALAAKWNYCISNIGKGEMPREKDVKDIHELIKLGYKKY
jgi:hypothetical protein